MLTDKATTTQTDALLNQDEAAAILNLENARTLSAWRLRRMGPKYICIGKRCIRYRRSDLESYIESCAVTPPAGAKP